MCEKADLYIKDVYSVSDGKKFKEWKTPTFYYDSKDKCVITDYFANDYDWPIFSKKYCEITKELFDGKVQYLPVNLYDIATKKLIEGEYMLINIINVINALDIDNSKYVYCGNEISITVPALIGKNIEGEHIFRLGEDRSFSFVSQRVKELIQENGLTNFGFWETGVY